MKERKKEVCGSISVYFSLILLLVLSLLATLLEGVRVEGLKANARMNRDLVTESVLAEYVKPLWEQYHLFAGNGMKEGGAWSTERVEQSGAVAARENLEWMESGKRGLWLYPMHAKGVTVEACHLLTDEEGEGFYRMAASYMRQNLAADAAEAIYNKVRKMQDAREEAGDMDGKVENAKTCIKQAAEEKEEEAADGGQPAEEPPETADQWEGGTEPENPLTYIGEWKSASLLALLGVDLSGLSAKTVDTGDCLERRKRNTGNWKQESESSDWYERVLFQEYLLKQFACYPVEEGADKEEKAAVRQQGDGNLEYELEYLLAGKGSDKQNLQKVLDRILLIREAANFICLQTDQKKKSEALTLATLLVGALGNGLLIKGVQQGILAVWAFAESVSDVRSLLAGEKIPIIKTAAQWSTDVGALSKETDFKNAGKCENGIGYADYLRGLLFLEDRGKLCYRAMDLIEWKLNSLDGYSGLRMDTLWDKCHIQYTYQAEPMFLSLLDREYCWSLSKTADYHEN